MKQGAPKRLENPVDRINTSHANTHNPPGHNMYAILLPSAAEVLSATDWPENFDEPLEEWSRRVKLSKKGVLTKCNVINELYGVDVMNTS